MLSIPDMALLGAAALIFFGPEQLPKVARKVGLLVRDVQNTSQTFIREMERAADEPAGGGEAVSRAHLLDEPPVPSYGAYGDVPLEVPAPEAHEVAHEEPAAHAPVASAGHETQPPTG
jgi:sec-independent protein translocase protein TatA